MAVLLQKLKDMVAAEKAGGSPKRGKKGGKKGDKKAKSGDGAKKEKKPKSEKAEKGGGGKKGKKDPTGDRSAESLYAELVSNGIVQPCPPRGFAEFVGAYSYLGTTLEKADIRPDPSLAQVRPLLHPGRFSEVTSKGKSTVTGTRWDELGAQGGYGCGANDLLGIGFQ